jgi:alpha-tubulin suppressor-like RCC1 family protein
MRIAGRAPASRLLTFGLITLIGSAAVLPDPTPARAFPFESSRWVWGNNTNGELGNNADQIADHPIRSNPFLLGTQLTRIAAGSDPGMLGSHSLAVDRDRHVWGWGLNQRGQVGDGGQMSKFGPVMVCAAGQAVPCTEFLSDITAAAAGGRHSLALDTFSNVWAWGSNDFGQLGSNVGTTSLLPVRNNALFAQLHQLPGPPSVTAIAAGGAHSLALDSRGVVWAWGANSDGQLGLGNLNNAVFALQITFSGDPVITAIAGGGFHSLALDSAGNVWAWGNNHRGQLGISSFDANRNTPVKLTFFPPNTRIVAIAAGGEHSLALDSAGNVFSWGANTLGQLGNGQNIDQFAPTGAIFPVGTPRILSISAGGSHNLVVDADHNVWAWGANGQGQLGNRQLSAPINAPVRADFPQGTRIVAVAAGGFHSLALESQSIFDLEAVLDFDALTVQPRLLPESFTHDPVDLQTTSETLDRKGKQLLVTHTLTDMAGNTFVLVLTDRRKNPTVVALELESVQYNGGAVLTLPKNRIKTRWKTDGNGAIIKLGQRLIVDAGDGVTKVSTKYLAAEDQTKIKVKTPAGKELFTAPGLVTVQVGTVNGGLGFTDGEHIWP